MRRPSDILSESVPAAVYFSKAGHYIFRQFERSGTITSKCLSARAVAQAFSGSSEDTGWLPPGVIRAGFGPGGAWYVYSRMPRFATINLVQSNGPRLFTVPLPGMLMFGIGHEYFIFAWAGETLDLDEAIYRAPLPNLEEDGKICWGQNNPPGASPATAEAACRLFFDSAFNGDLANGKCRRYPQDVRKLLRKLSGEERFPDEELVRVRNRGISVRDYLDGLIEEKN